MPNPIERVEKMDPYTVSESAKLSNGEKSEYLKLDWNESNLPPSPEVNAALVDVIENGHFEYYPDVSASELRRKLGEYTRLDPSHLLVFNGSDDGLRTIIDTYIGKDDTVLIREPVYTQPYTFINANEGDIRTFTAPSPFDKGINEFADILSKSDIRLSYLPNPNNPTGVCYSPTDIERIVQKFPETIFIVDEAYYEFAETTVIDLVTDYENLVVTRTFSKAFGLAGLRVGYVAAHDSIVSELEKVRNGKNVNLLGQIAASVALDNEEHMWNNVRDVRETREWLVKKLRNNGFDVKKTPANYILIKLDDPNYIVNKLKEENILVRNRTSLPQLDGYIRVSIGTRSQMKTFFESIQNYI